MFPPEVRGPTPLNYCVQTAGSTGKPPPILADTGRVNRQDPKNAKEPAGELDTWAHRVIGAAIEVHRHLGPGFLESVYEGALVVELGLRGSRSGGKCLFRFGTRA